MPDFSVENQRRSKSRKGKECEEGRSTPLAHTTNMKNNENPTDENSFPAARKKKNLPTLTKSKPESGLR